VVTVGLKNSYARTLFPAARIICVEPDPDNCANFKRMTPDPNTILIRKAIGSGQVYRHPDASNGAKESYVTACTGYERVSGALPAVPVDSILPDALIAQYRKPGDRAIMKIDIEGNDNAVWDHAPSMAAIRSLDYIAIEVHRCALTGDRIDAVNNLTRVALQSFSPTHDCQEEHVIFTARKR